MSRSAGPLQLLDSETPSLPSAGCSNERTLSDACQSGPQAKLCIKYSYRGCYEDVLDVSSGSVNVSGRNIDRVSAALPNNTIVLLLDKNALKGFDIALPPNLQLLDLSGNKLTSFSSSLPSSLQDLRLNRNSLTSFDTALPSQLRSLNISENNLASFQARLPDSIEDLDVSNNPDLKCFRGRLPKTILATNTLIPCLPVARGPNSPPACAPGDDSWDCDFTPTSPAPATRPPNAPGGSSSSESSSSSVGIGAGVGTALALLLLAAAVMLLLLRRRRRRQRWALQEDELDADADSAKRRSSGDGSKVRVLQEDGAGGDETLSKPLSAATVPPSSAGSAPFSWISRGLWWRSKATTAAACAETVQTARHGDQDDGGDDETAQGDYLLDNDVTHATSAATPQAPSLSPAAVTATGPFLRDTRGQAEAIAGARSDDSGEREPPEQQSQQPLGTRILVSCDACSFPVEIPSSVRDGQPPEVPCSKCGSVQRTLHQEPEPAAQPLRLPSGVFASYCYVCGEQLTFPGQPFCSWCGAPQPVPMDASQPPQVLQVVSAMLPPDGGPRLSARGSGQVVAMRDSWRVAQGLTMISENTGGPSAELGRQSQQLGTAAGHPSRPSATVGYVVPPAVGVRQSAGADVTLGSRGSQLAEKELPGFYQQLSLVQQQQQPQIQQPQQQTVAGPSDKQPAREPSTSRSGLQETPEVAARRSTASERNAPLLARRGGRGEVSCDSSYSMTASTEFEMEF